MTAPETDPVPTADVARAARYVRAGGLLILPTDTVYGIGTTARDGDAVARLLAAKGRGRQAPPPVLVPGPQALDGLVVAEHPQPDGPTTLTVLMTAPTRPA